jgi:hypothetical protein
MGGDGGLGKEQLRIMVPDLIGGYLIPPVILIKKYKDSWFLA